MAASDDAQRDGEGIGSARIVLAPQTLDISAKLRYREDVEELVRRLEIAKQDMPPRPARKKFGPPPEGAYDGFWRA